VKPETDFTQAPAATPMVSGAMVSIFVPDDHSMIRLKQALDWPQVKEIIPHNDLKGET
jgi:hypothetical protein